MNFLHPRLLSLIEYILDISHGVGFFAYDLAVAEVTLILDLIFLSRA